RVHVLYRKTSLDDALPVLAHGRRLPQLCNRADLVFLIDARKAPPLIVAPGEILRVLTLPVLEDRVWRLRQRNRERLLLAALRVGQVERVIVEVDVLAAQSTHVLVPQS